MSFFLPIRPLPAAISLVSCVLILHFFTDLNHPYGTKREEIEPLRARRSAEEGSGRRHKERGVVPKKNKLRTKKKGGKALINSVEVDKVIPSKNGGKVFNEEKEKKKKKRRAVQRKRRRRRNSDESAEEEEDKLSKWKREEDALRKAREQKEKERKKRMALRKKRLLKRKREEEEKRREERRLKKKRKKQREEEERRKRAKKKKKNNGQNNRRNNAENQDVDDDGLQSDNNNNGYDYGQQQQNNDIDYKDNDVGEIVDQTGFIQNDPNNNNNNDTNDGKGGDSTDTANGNGAVSSGGQGKSKNVAKMMIQLALQMAMSGKCRWCALQFLEKAALGPFAPLAIFISPKTFKRIRTVIKLGKSVVKNPGAVVKSAGSGAKAAGQAVSNLHVDQKAGQAAKAVANTGAKAADTAKNVFKKIKFG